MANTSSVRPSSMPALRLFVCVGADDMTAVLFCGEHGTHLASCTCRCSWPSERSEAFRMPCRGLHIRALLDSTFVRCARWSMLAR